jgi:predicted Rossmann-fold nucleotide-binding protein
MKISAVTVFCGSKPGNDPQFVIAAETLGKALASKGIVLVYGGGNKGIMGAVANASLDAGGKVIGGTTYWTYRINCY